MQNDIFKIIKDICMNLLSDLRNNSVSFKNHEGKEIKEYLNNLLTIIKILKCYDIKDEKNNLTNEDRKFIEFLIKNKKKRFLLLLIPGEWHDISLLFANYIIRSKGVETIYLGQDVPYENIARLVKQTQPTVLLTFLTVTQDPEEMINNFKKCIPASKNLKILTSGNVLMTQHLQQKFNADVLGKPGDLLKYL